MFGVIVHTSQVEIFVFSFFAIHLCLLLEKSTDLYLPSILYTLTRLYPEKQNVFRGFNHGIKKNSLIMGLSRKERPNLSYLNFIFYMQPHARDQVAQTTKRRR